MGNEPQAFDEVVAEIKAGREMQDAGMWIMGNAALAGIEVYGGKLRQVAKLAGVEYRTLVRYRRVVRRFGGRPFNALSFTHHELAASMDDAEEWLAKAEAERWTTAKLRRELQAAYEAKYG